MKAWIQILSYVPNLPFIPSVLLIRGLDFNRRSLRLSPLNEPGGLPKKVSSLIDSDPRYVIPNFICFNFGLPAGHVDKFIF